MHLPKVLCAVGLIIGSAAIAVPAATDAGAVGGITYYVNSSTSTGAIDCASATNVDCGIADAVTAFDADSTSNDADVIVFSAGISTFSGAYLQIINSTPGVTLSIEGNGSDATTITGGGETVFTIDFPATVTISSLTITGGSWIAGGAILSDGTLALTNDTLSDDTAVLEGGALFNEGVATLTNDTFSGDSADQGGAIDNEGEVTLTNDTFWGDSASAGGAIFNDMVATLTNDTFSHDGAGSSAAIYDLGNVDIANSIFDSASCFIAGLLVDNGYNVESDASCGAASTDVTNSSSINAAASLAANGSTGPETVAIDPTSSAYEEVPASSCGVATDERGDPRPGVSDAACDAGAFEYQGTATTARSAQTVSVAPIGNVTLGAAPLTLSGTASSGLAIIYTSKDPTVCAVSGSTVTILAAGTCTVVASQGGDSQFIPAATEQTFQVDAVATAVRHVPGPAHIRRAIALSTGGVVLVVSAPSNGGSPLTSYQYSVNGRAWVNAALGGRVVVTGLRKSSIVTLRVRARNAIGAGPASNAERVSVR
jgi:hypothetical protein